MKILIAEDDALFRRTLKELLLPAYQLQVVEDGDLAWEALQRPDPPKLAILDWVMPGLSGPQLCRKVRACAESSSTYIILLTSRNSIADIIAGLHSGADDYVTKPFDPEELRARVRVGERVLNLQSSLSTKLVALENALTNEKLLQHLLPVCPACKGHRDDVDYWHEVQDYLSTHDEAGNYQQICPHCQNGNSSEHTESAEVLMELHR